jgi:hypothetical protein
MVFALFANANASAQRGKMGCCNAAMMVMMMMMMMMIQSCT